MSRKAASKGSSELGYVGHPRSVFGWSGSDGSARAKDLFMAANVVEEFLINAELVAVDIQRVLLADESNPGPSSAKVWALLRSNAGTMAAAILMLARTLPRPCPRLPEACQLHGPITRSRRSQAPTTPPNAVSHLAFSRPRAGTSPTSVCGSTASTGGRPGRHCGLTKPAWMSLAGTPPPGTRRFPRWRPPRSCQQRRRAYTTPATRSAATYTSNHQKGKDPPAQLRSVE